jgi:hypothetical protein
MRMMFWKTLFLVRAKSYCLAITGCQFLGLGRTAGKRVL